MITDRSCLILVVLCLLGTTSLVHGQPAPMVNFSNNDLLNGVNAPFYDVDGTTRLEGGTYHAQLYYGSPNVAPAEWNPTTAAPQPFRTGAGAGYWQSSQRPLTGFVAGERVGIQVRFWDSENGTVLRFEDAELRGRRIGVSVPIIVTMALPPSVTPMTGLQSASLVPVITLTRGTPIFTQSGSASDMQMTTLCGVRVGPNRWFRLMSSYSGSALLTTAGSEIDTVMGVFRGSIVSPSALSPVTCNDDFAAGVTSSQVQFPVQANTLYLLCVAGKNGATNTIRLSHTLATELQIRRMGSDHIELSWPADATNCAAEAAAGLHGAWETITNAPVIITNRKVLTLGSGAGGETVYRLRLNPAP